MTMNLPNIPIPASNLPIFIMILIPAFLGVVLFLYRTFNSPARKFRKTTYHKLTHNSYQKIQDDKGAYGEYQIYQNLASYERDGARFLFNCYLPWRSGETTEIDALMIHHSGIYVFESKNYGGTISGRPVDDSWIQTLPGKRNSKIQNSFFNPILQNRSHINCLKQLLPKEFFTRKKGVPIYSVIAFSDHCDLKAVARQTIEYVVTTYSSLPKTVATLASKNRRALSSAEVTQIAKLLSPYMHVSTAQKRQHNEEVQKYAEKSSSTPRKTPPRR